MTKLVKSLVALAATVGAVAAHAEEVTFAQYTLFPNNVYMVATANGGASYKGTLVGEIDATTTSGKSFAAYCIDLPRDLGGPSTYTITQETQAAIGKLFAVAGFSSSLYATDSVDTAVEAAGLQLAIWEAFYDGLTTVDFGAGQFRALGSQGAAALVQAQTYLSAAASLTSGYQPYVQVLYSTNDPTRQTLVTSVPEPSTYALMAACLGVVGFVARRKQA